MASSTSFQEHWRAVPRALKCDYDSFMTLERKKEILEKNKPKLDRIGAPFLFEEINLFITITPANSLISYEIKPQKADTKTTILSSNLNHKLRWSKPVIESTPRLQIMNGALVSALAFRLVYGGH